MQVGPAGIHPPQVGHILSEAIGHARPWLDSYGLAAVFVGLFLETLCFTGAWCPGAGILLAGGYLSAEGVLPTWTTLLVACLGAALGDQASYCLGYACGLPLLGRHAGRAGAIGAVLEREGPWLILAYHYSPALRVLLPCAAGAGRYCRRRWLCYDTAGVALWTGVYFGLGYSARSAVTDAGNLAVNLVNAASVGVLLWVSCRVGRALVGPGGERAARRGHDGSGKPG